MAKLPIGGTLGFLFLVFAVEVPALQKARHESAACLEVLRSGELPQAVEWANDVRWAAENSVYLSLPLHGVFEWTLGKQEATLWAARGHGRREVFLPHGLATTARHVVVASAFYAFGYGSRQSPGIEAVFPLEETLDIDAWGEQVVTYGSQRDADGSYAPEGALAWLGRLGQEPSLWKPLYLSESGPGIPNFAKCGLMMVGAVRFLNDGSILVVPGVEGGVYLYASNGKLLRADSAERLGFDSGCPLDQEQAEPYRVDEKGRWDWVNTRRVIDEILPLPDGNAGLVVRELVAGEVRFSLQILRRDGSLRSCALPFGTKSIHARLQADVRGNEMIVVLTQRGHQPGIVTGFDYASGKTTRIPPKHHPDQPTRYFIARYLP